MMLSDIADLMTLAHATASALVKVVFAPVGQPNLQIYFPLPGLTVVKRRWTCSFCSIVVADLQQIADSRARQKLTSQKTSINQRPKMVRDSGFEPLTPAV